MDDAPIHSQPLALKPIAYLKHPARLKPLGKAAQTDLQTQKLKTACDNFEALFMQQLLKQMRATIPKDPMLGGGMSEEIYTEMFDAELSKEMAGSGGLGISRLLFEYMTAAQKMGGGTKD
jgi:Rod binding domain-containing protein